MPRPSVAPVVALLAALLLAGCSGGGDDHPDQDGDSERPGVGGPLQGDTQDDDARVPGALLQAQAFGDAGAYTLEAILSNEGDGTYVVRTVCGAALVEGLRRDGELVAHRAPQDCPEATAAWPPGSVEHPTFTWDGTLWHANTADDAAATGEEGRFVPAPPGTYEWTVGATLRTAPGATEAVQLRARFTVAFA